ncbi:MAG: hypothetical protein AAGF66_00715 [Cyanobacteria bacterium P01_H01_bin.119]
MLKFDPRSLWAATLLITGGLIGAEPSQGHSACETAAGCRADCTVDFASPVPEATVAVRSALRSLPSPLDQSSDQSPCEIFSANAYGQVAFNFQRLSSPESIAAFYQRQLPQQGYEAVALLQVVGDWGFSLVFELPPGDSLSPRSDEKRVVLVLQGVMLSPDQINVNLRYEEI